MDIDDLEAALRASIDDRRVTRGERKALRALIDDAGLDTHRRRLVRAKAFEIARYELDAPGAREVLDWLEAVAGLVAPIGSDRQEPGHRGGGAAEAWFSPGHAPLKAIVAQMRMARSSIDVCVFTITDDRISDGLIAVANRGINVRILSDDEKVDDEGSDLKRLIEAGIPVALDRSAAHMHHKFAIFDRQRLLTGSFNWTRSASGENHENVLVTEDTRLVRAYEAEFERLWKQYA